jgi:hypothetical protein
MYLFKEGQHLDIDDPPDIIKQSEEMRQVMNSLSEFSENQRNFLLYQSRLEGEMARLTFERTLEKALKEKEKERKEKETALEEIQRLKKLLKTSS